MNRCVVVATLVATSVILSACTYNANVAPAPAAASEVLPTRRLPYTVSYFVDPSVATLEKNAQTGFTCSAHAFPVNVGPAISSTIRSVNAVAFANAREEGSRNEGADGVKRHIVLDLIEFNPKLDFSQGFWTSRAHGRVEIVLRAIALDETNKTILTATISGEGSADQTGGCSNGADALAEAANKAVRRLGQDYANKFVNAQQL